MKIVIIEDEQYTAQDLESCILELRPDFQIVKILGSVKEATSYFRKENNYDLVFSDIQLGDGLSFDIYKNILPAAPVIFCTAYNNYAIEAFRANGIDYILKPVSKPNILSAIEKYERLVKPASPKMNMELLLEMFGNKAAEKNSGSLLVHHKDKIIPIKLEDIAVFYIQNEGCRIMDFGGRHFSISETLDKAEKITGNSFFRANRQFLVNRKAVKDVSQGFSRTHTLSLTVDFKEAIVISKEKAPLLFRWLAE
ncbi:MAG: LytR/AlgR family response regulator transcription factor [Bacteroidia bacterium]